VQQNIKCRIKGDKYFVDEVETQLREEPLQGSQTQDIHYLEDKARYKVVTLFRRRLDRASGRSIATAFPK
jgi:hypothetical protein